MEGLLGALGGLVKKGGMKNMMGLIGSRMKDQKGLFQGGMEGVPFGRVKDFIKGIGGNSIKDRTREFAKSFDPSSKKDVFKLQNMLNSSGYTDSEGNELATDSIFGDKTLSALRNIQGGDEGGAPKDDNIPFIEPVEDKPFSDTMFSRDEIYGGGGSSSNVNKNINKLFPSDNYDENKYNVNVNSARDLINSKRNSQ